MRASPKISFISLLEQCSHMGFSSLKAFFLRGNHGRTSVEADIIKGFFFPSRGAAAFEELGDPGGML